MVKLNLKTGRQREKNKNWEDINWVGIQRGELGRRKKKKSNDNLRKIVQKTRGCLVWKQKQKVKLSRREPDKPQTLSTTTKTINEKNK